VLVAPIMTPTNGCTAERFFGGDGHVPRKGSAGTSNRPSNGSCVHLLLFLLTALVLSDTAQGQCAAGPCGDNLAPNPGFEDPVTCPLSNTSRRTYTDLTPVQGWYGTMPSAGGLRPTYFNSQCSSGSVTVAMNYSFSSGGSSCSISASAGFTPPASACAGTGTGYMGIHTRASCQAREYIQAQLSSPLVAGREYCLSFQARSRTTTSTSDGVGMWLHNGGLININTMNGGVARIGPGTSINASPQLENPQGNIISTTCQTITGTYCATGGEQWVVIGNFRDNAATGGSTTGYLFIDDVSIRESCATNITVSASASPDGMCGAGGCATLSVTASGGSGTFTHTWSPGGGTGPSIVVCPSATTTYTVTTESPFSTCGGGTATDVRTVTVTISEVNGTMNGYNIWCPGGTGSATVTPTGGAVPYDVAWNTTPPQTGPTATGLPPGSYTATITDAIGCTATLPVTIDEVEPPTSPVCASGTMANAANADPGDPANPYWGCLGNAPLLGSWYVITAVAGGDLGFAIQPEGPSNNYDWALWGPFPAVSGAPIPCLPPPQLPLRCEASTNTATFASTGSYDTGMGQHATPLFAPSSTPYFQSSPGCGGQCGWVPGIQVQPGEGYLLYVDNRAQNGTVFDLIWSLGGASIVCSPLPVELVGLRAEPQGGQVLLTWTTLSERASHRFLVERGGMDLRFEPIGTVQAAGWSSSPVHYRYLDQTPFPGTNYYRLREEDLDGMHHYSITVSASLQSHGAMTLHPNPADDHITVDHPFGRRASSLEVHDASGRLAVAQPFNVDGVEASIHVPLRHLEAGTYVLRLLDSERHSLGSGRFIKR